MENNRVVITGMGICAPNGVTLDEFNEAIQKGKSGIKFYEDLAKHGYSCQIGGIPELSDERISKYFTDLELRHFSSTGVLYAVVSGMDAWKDAKLEPNDEHCDFDSGTIFGTGTIGTLKMRETMDKIDNMQKRRLSSNTVQQTMGSAASAYLGGKLGLGNIVSSNSSACTTGTEALLMAYERIKAGQAKRILAGSTSEGGLYTWGPFDVLRILPYEYNDNPTEASRPMDANAKGFVPSSGAGALVLESLESAQERGAHIYAEVLGGSSNSGGMRNGGSMTAPNPLAVQHCITQAVKNAAIAPDQIDAINGHLTATGKDGEEVHNWSIALGRKGKDFPYINSLKGMTGHCLAAAGSVECVASVLQLEHQYIFPNINIDEIHPEIKEVVDASRIPLKRMDATIDILAKASFGFGDVNCCVIFSRF